MENTSPSLRKSQSLGHTTYTQTWNEKTHSFDVEIVMDQPEAPTSVMYLESTPRLLINRLTRAQVIRSKGRTILNENGCWVWQGAKAARGYV